MTTIYNDYYKNIESGRIDPKDVNFSAYIVDGSYVPVAEHRKNQVTGKIDTLVKVLIGGDISTLTMSEIIAKVRSKLSDEEYNQAAGFAVYDIATQELCFYEPFEKPNLV